MVRIIYLALTGAAASLLLVGCNRSAPSNAEGTEFAMVEQTLDRLSPDIALLTGSAVVTNIQLLRADYRRSYPERPPLFFAAPLKPVYPRDSEYQLPLRVYYWLTEWSPTDSSDSPLFWSYFHIPNDVASYVTIGGSQSFCPSNEFQVLIAAFSNRVERVTLEVLTNSM